MAKDIRMYNMENWFDTLFKKYRKKRLDYKAKEMEYRLFGEGVTALPEMISYVLFYGVIVLKFFKGEMQISDVIFYNGMISGFMLQRNSGMTNLHHLINSVSAFGRYKEFIIYGDDMSAEAAELKKAAPQIELKHVSFAYPSSEHNIIDDMSLKIDAGEKIAVVGLNGAGKTTFLKMISGLANPSSGDYSLFGYSGKDLSKVRSRVGCLIEEPGLYINMSAYDNLMIKAKLFGISDKKYVSELLDMVGLADVGKKKTKNFSLGMKQLLGIALAMVGNPDFLVLDEPINGLDPQGIVEVRDMLAGLAKERNITILISSHILEELSKVCTDFGIIHKGNLLQELSQEQLMQQCSKRIELVLDEPKKAVVTLDEIGVHDYEVIDKSHIYIYERLEESAYINERLVNSGVCPREIKVNQEELESYFLNMTAD